MRIRRGLASRRLACGCVAGVYETYRDEIVTILDAKGPHCGESAHSAGKVLPLAVTDELPAEPHPRGR